MVLRGSDPKRKHPAHCLQGSGVGTDGGYFLQTLELKTFMTHAHAENGMVEIGSFTPEQLNVFRVNSGWGCVRAKCVLSRFSRV